jgi:hypothetical protein
LGLVNFIGIRPVVAGDGGGAGSSAGEVVGDGLDSVEVVNELSDVKLYEDTEVVDREGMMVFVLFCLTNCPLLLCSMKI